MNRLPLRDRAAMALKRAVKAALAPFNLTLTRVEPYSACTPEWVDEAQAEGMAVNDFIEKDHRKPASAELEKLVFPHISADSIVCELGPGTGVYTRHISKVVTAGEFHVVDSDPSAIDFLRKHLPKNPSVRLHHNSGTALPFDTGSWVDLAFCANMFTGGNLSYFYRYIQEFARVLKPGGRCVFDYFDIATEAGWDVLTKNMARQQPIYAYTYHATATVDKVLASLGFEVLDRFPTIRGSMFVAARKT